MDEEDCLVNVVVDAVAAFCAFGFLPLFFLLSFDFGSSSISF